MLLTLGCCTRSASNIVADRPGSVDDLAARIFRSAQARFISSSFPGLPVDASWLRNTSALRNSYNCSRGQGATYESPLPEPVRMAECFARCEEDRRCEAVRVDWEPVAADWTVRAVGCALLGGVDASKCAVPTTRQHSTFAVDAPALSQLILAIVALGGYLPSVRGTEGLASAAPWPGEAGGRLPALFGAMRGERSLGLRAIRVSIPAGEGFFAVLRYDALGTGEAAVAVVNLGARDGAAELNVSALPPALLRQRPTDLLRGGPAPALSKPINVQAHSYAVLTGLRLPRWTALGAKFRCKATYAPAARREPLAACLVSCLHDERCDAVTVTWVETHTWPAPAAMPWRGDTVLCQLLGGVDASTCEDDASGAHSTIAVDREGVSRAEEAAAGSGAPCAARYTATAWDMTCWGNTTSWECGNFSGVVPAVAVNALAGQADPDNWTSVASTIHGSGAPWTPNQGNKGWMHGTASQPAGRRALRFDAVAPSRIDRLAAGGRRRYPWRLVHR